MDELLLLYLKINRKKAFDLIYKSYNEKVTRLCYKILYNKFEVEDTVQEVFLKIFQNIDKFNFKSNIGTWIYRITVNHIFNKNKKLDFFLEFDESYISKYSEFNIEYKELEKEIAKSLDQLKDIEKKVFILREMEGLSYKNISKILNIKEGTVKSKLYYVKQKLRNLLKEYLGS